MTLTRIVLLLILVLPVLFWKHEGEDHDDT